MARKRRKSETRTADKAHSRKPSVPIDTNLEVLPAKSTSGNGTLLSQNVSEGGKITGKKRKRLDKYIENKLRKEEAAALMKKLSDRIIDTTSLRSTKTIGQSKGAAPENRRDRRWNSVNLEDEDAAVGVVDAPLTNSLPVSVPEQQLLSASSPIVTVPSVGTALKKDTIQRIVRASHAAKRKSRCRPSWRDRLANQRSSYGNEVSEGSSFDTSSDSDIESEYSEWNGISDGDEAEDVPGDVHTDNRAQSPGVSSAVPLVADEKTDTDPESSNTENSSEGEDDGNAQTRAKEFKEWAREQSGFGGSISNISSLPQLPPGLKTPYINALDEPVLAKVEKSKPSFFIPMKRKLEIQETRLSLPIISQEQQIMETLSDNDCIVICGETGSGKTTQLPQFLFEAGYGSAGSERPGLIGVTQPRRVAAVSMATRVAEELGPPHEKRIRFDASLNADTAIKFMTDGVLLREIAVDLLLSKYSAIIVDEAHERSVNTDVLIGVLSRVVRLRREMSQEPDSKVKSLKLIIMSATMRVTDFTANNILFSQAPPVINVDTRQFPVTIHFSKKTNLSNHVEEAVNKIAKIHQRLPPGGILVFLTGQDEIRHMCNRLQERFPAKAVAQSDEDILKARVKCLVTQMDMETEDVDIEHDGDYVEEENLEDDSDESDSEFGEDGLGVENVPLHVLPLYSLLPVADQLKVFHPPPTGTRLCVVATNIAETSLTIPGIKYVVDCGRVKERVYDKATGVESFQIGWISKASAAQRTGRAGRTGPGHCYRLYSSAIFERDFPQFSEPEILKYPIEGIVLQMKGMHIDKVVNFPFPTPPDRESLRQSEKLLEYLGALDKDHRITPLGRSMSAFPLQPRHSKMIILGQQFNNMPYLIAIVAGLSVGDPFIGPEEIDAESQDGSEESTVVGSKMRKYEESRQKFSALDPECDVLRLLCAIGAYEAGGSADSFCVEHFLRIKVMKEIRKLRIQITNIVNNQLSGIVAPVQFSANLQPPSALQIRTIKQVVTAAYLDRIAIRSDLVDSNSPSKKTTKTSRAEYLPMIAPTRQAMMTDFASIHPRSAVANASSAPEYIVYSDIRASQKTGRLRLMPLTTMSPREIEPLARGTPLIQYSKPLNYPPPRVFTDNGVMKKEIYVVPRFGTHGRGWELPSIKRVENLVKNDEFQS